MTQELSRAKSEKYLAADRLIQNAIDLIRQNYGENSENPLAYHNEQHTLEVIEAAEKIAERLVEDKILNSEDIVLIRLAAAYHDTVHGQGSGVNESKSAAIAQAVMKEAGVFDPEDIDKVQKMIMGTVMRSKDGRLVQSAGDNLLAQVLADADLAPLGTELNAFWHHALSLWRETSSSKTMDEDQLRHFLDTEINFLSDHQFYTSAAEEIYPNKQNNLNWLIERRSSLSKT